LCGGDHDSGIGWLLPNQVAGRCAGKEKARVQKEVQVGLKEKSGEAAGGEEEAVQELSRFGGRKMIIFSTDGRTEGRTDDQTY